VVLATLENVTVEVAGLAPQTISLGIDEEGLVIGPYGKLAWAGSQLWVEGDSIDVCTVHIQTSTGANSTFTVPAASLGPVSAPAFARWIEHGAAYFGATVVTNAVSV
jgi:hypothetical protein